MPMRVIVILTGVTTLFVLVVVLIVVVGVLVAMLAAMLAVGRLRARLALHRLGIAGVVGSAALGNDARPIIVGVAIIGTAVVGAGLVSVTGGPTRSSNAGQRFRVPSAA